MNSLRARFQAFQRSTAGLFVQKLTDDQAPNLASLLAWSSLSAILPLILGVLSIAGLLLRDPQVLDQVYNTVLALVPGQAAGPVSDALQGVRMASAAPAGVVALVLLLYNGSSFFSNMASVFNQAYHVTSRNFFVERLIAIAMLVITTILLVVATLAVGLGSLVGNVPISLPVGPTLARVISGSLSILSAFVLFLLSYKLLPNARQSWRSVLPGAIVASTLTFVISMVFPLYVRLFPPNQAYAVFGVFLLFTFWLYLLGFIIVLGAEMNAFLEQPSRLVAPAVSTSPARQAQVGRPSLAGRLLGFVGLLVAVLVLRGRTATPSDERASA
jgi:membrane protein